VPEKSSPPFSRIKMGSFSLVACSKENRRREIISSKKYVETRCGKLSKCALFLQDDALLVPLEKFNKTVFKIANHSA
jgi:hypothetical protein